MFARRERIFSLSLFIQFGSNAIILYTLAVCMCGARIEGRKIESSDKKLFFCFYLASTQESDFRNGQDTNRRQLCEWFLLLLSFVPQPFTFFQCMALVDSIHDNGAELVKRK